MPASLRLAARSLRKSPGFTLTAVATLALGIGVNTAMFSVVNTLLLRPAPYPQPDRLVRLFRTTAEARDWTLSLPDLRDAATSDAFATVTPFQWWSFSLAEPGQPAELLHGAIASANLFTTLGVQPFLGRGFTAEEQQPGRDRVAVISHEYWQRHFGGDRTVIGRVLRIDGQGVEVIGVMPAQAEYPLFWGRLDLWRPLPLNNDWRESRDVRWLNAIARLKPGVPAAQAQASASAIAGRLAHDFPGTNAGQGLAVVPLVGSELNAAHRALTWLTLGLSGFVLLIACANLGNLQLARHAARVRDLAVRAALGASRGRLVREALVESLLLAAAGGATGLVLAWGLMALLAPQMLWPADSISLDHRVIGFVVLATLVAGLVSGCAPAWFTARTDVNGGLKSDGRGTTGDRSRQRARQALIVSQVAFSLVLLAGSGFFLRGLQRFLAQDPGWRIEGLAKGTLTLPDTVYRDDASRHAFHQRVLERVARLPGVESAALATEIPLQETNSARAFEVEGRPAPPPGREPIAYGSNVTAGYFSTLGLKLVAGRIFSDDAGPDDPRQIVINESMARQLWPGQSALGKRIRDTGTVWHPWLEVVGVVRDATFAGSFGAVPTRLQYYMSLAQNPWGYFTLVVRGAAPPALVEPIRRAVGELDPDLPVVGLMPMQDAVVDAQQEFRMANKLLVAFAALGLGLAAIGLYGVISAFVVQRTREFGIRLALGAPPQNVLLMVLGRGAGLTVIGAAAGLGCAVALLRVLGSLFPGLPGEDWVGITGAVVVLLLVTLAACWLPARRATKVDPMVALRAE
ncbi:MAG TPA: ABC transporter permease [Lacunisphaera sp.]|nr:ABC transporter permease [Lacunisphaera sp.]